MYGMLPKDTGLFGELVEHFDEGARKILILKLIDGHTFKHHKDTAPCVKDLSAAGALKIAI